MRQPQCLTSAVSLLLGQVRKRGLRRALSRHTADTAMPVWRNGAGLPPQLGDEVRAVMAATQRYQPQSVAFPQDAPATPRPAGARGRGGHPAATEKQPTGGRLLDWLHTHHGHLQDATLLWLFP